MRVYKILTDEQLAAFRRAARFAGAPVDLADGYVHLSTGPQLAGTLRRHFAGQRDLWLIGCDAGKLGAELRFEPARGGELFPHLYRPLVLADVEDVQPIEDGPDGHRLPPDVA